MLRLTLDSASEQLVPLEREIEFVERYFAIMQTRLGERLHYECDIKLAAHRALVPPFLLQPLVENAILHGIEPITAGGVVTLMTNHSPGSGFDGCSANSPAWRSSANAPMAPLRFEP